MPVQKLLYILLLTGVFLSCRKDKFTDSPNAILYTTIDTLHFDTLFTTAGSVTHFFKLFNDNREGVRISEVRLAGGSASPFRINVDGTPGPSVRQIELAGNDSLYVFVTVRIDPGAGDLPFLVRDSIEISYNNNRQWIQLEAYGQNANFLRNRRISGNEVWENDRPYVILGGLTIDTTGTLTINKGVRVHFHADAPFVIHGSLQVNGERWDSTRVHFMGDRLDAPYKNFPAAYPGLYFSPASRGNRLSYVVIKNAYQGIVLEGPTGTSTPKLVLQETIIDNAYDAGLIAVNSSISSQNLLISNCGKNMVLAGGGEYDFTHATLAAYSTSFIPHKEPVLFVSNQINTGSPQPLSAVFRNCIFWGEGNGLVNEEVLISKLGTSPFLVQFRDILWRVNGTPSNATVTGNVVSNADPQFDSVDVSNRFFSFRLQNASPAINKGSATPVSIDLDGMPRPIGLPDLGAYEKQ